MKKTLACAQALWFCVQCITRLAQSLPVSLLELNTFGHALCTLAIYIFWWSKPLDIDEPTVILNDRLYPIMAYMWMSSRVSAKGHHSDSVLDSLQDEFHCIWPSREPTLGDLVVGEKHLVGGDQHCPSGSPEHKYPNPNKSHARNENSNTERGFEKSVCTVSRPNNRWSFLNLMATLRIHQLAHKLRKEDPVVHLSAADFHRWKLASEAIDLYNLEEDLRSRHRTATIGRFFSAPLNLRIPFLDAVRDNMLNPRVELLAPNAIASCFFRCRGAKESRVKTGRMD